MFSPLKRAKRPPFVIAYKAMLRNPKVSLAAKALFLVLKTYANRDGTHCFPSIQRIANDSGCSRSSVDRLLKELRVSGLIYSQQRAGKGNRLTSSTYLLYDDIQARAVYKTHKPRVTRDKRPTSPVTHGEGKKVVPFTEERACRL